MPLSLGVRAARFLTASPARTALMGAGIGAAGGAATAPEDARISGAFRGALGGAAVGGIGGGLGRAYRDTRLLAAHAGKPLSSAAAIPATAGRVGKQLVNFGRRQVYGLTGWGDADAMRMAGKATSARKARLLDLRAGDEMAHAATPEVKAQLRSNADAAMKAEHEAGVSAQSIQDSGVTNLPGMYKALRDPARRSGAFKAMGRTMGESPTALGIGLGLPLALSVPDIMRGDETAKGGKSMSQKVIGLGANMATGAAFGGMPIFPQMALGMGAESVVNRALRPKDSPNRQFLTTHSVGPPIGDPSNPTYGNSMDYRRSR